MLSLTLQVVYKNVLLFICTIALSSFHEEFINEIKNELLHGLPLFWPQVSRRSIPQPPPEGRKGRTPRMRTSVLTVGTSRFPVRPPSDCSCFLPLGHSPELVPDSPAPSSSHAGKATLCFLLMFRPLAAQLSTELPFPATTPAAKRRAGAPGKRPPPRRQHDVCWPSHPVPRRESSAPPAHCLLAALAFPGSSKQPATLFLLGTTKWLRASKAASQSP